MRKHRCPRCGLLEAVFVKPIEGKPKHPTMLSCSSCEHVFSLQAWGQWTKRSSEVGDKKAIQEYRTTNGLPLGDVKDSGKFMDLFFKLLGAGFVIAVIGAIGELPWLIALGALLMAPLFISIALAMANMVAEGAQSIATGFAGPQLGKVAYWGVFVIVAILFLWGGTGAGPRFWGSID